MNQNDSVALHVTKVGDSGQAIVFLHGLFGQGKNFSSIAKGLEPDFHSYLIDLPNHGKSGWTAAFSYVQAAKTVADWLCRNIADETPVHLVGHSMGGKIAMVLAMQNPDLVERLVVVDISPVEFSDQSEFEHLLGSLADLNLDEITSRKDADELLREPIPNNTVRGFLLQNLRREADGFAWQANLDMLHRDLPKIGGFPDDLTGTFEGPVLWVAGAKSDYVRPEYEATMKRFFPNTHKLTVKEAGHWVHSEQPEVFTTALRVFLSRRVG